jgi:hypothetical protein
VPTKKRHLRRLTTLPFPAWFQNAEAVCLHSGVNSPASMRHIGRTTFQCKFVLVLVFFTYNIICEQLINISLILFIFKFTNIEASRVITSAFKSSMEIPLFQWSKVYRHPDWRPYIDAWFRRFEVSVNFKFYLFFMLYWNYWFIFNKLFIHRINSSGITLMTMLWGGCGRITWQLGNIENVTIIFF